MFQEKIHVQILDKAKILRLKYTAASTWKSWSFAVINVIFCPIPRAGEHVVSWEHTLPPAFLAPQLGQQPGTHRCFQSWACSPWACACERCSVPVCWGRRWETWCWQSGQPFLLHSGPGYLLVKTGRTRECHEVFSLIKYSTDFFNTAIFFLNSLYKMTNV